MDDALKPKSRRGGARANSGRPKGSYTGGAPKSGRIVILCTAEEDEKLRAMALASGKSISRFIVDSILK